MFWKKIIVLLIVPFMFMNLFPGPSDAPADNKPSGLTAKTVVQMQQLMNGNGCWSGAAQGILADEAYQAVVALQMDNHLLTDGLVGSRTRQAPQPALPDAAATGQPDMAEAQVKVGSSVAAAANVEPAANVGPAVQAPVKVAQKEAKPVPSRGSAAAENRVITMVATGYDGCYECNKPYYGYPSYSGLPLARGIVAVDPNVIPMGTRLYVEGYGSAIAADQGNAIKGNRIDLYFDSHQEALNFGKKTVKVTILGK